MGTHKELSDKYKILLKKYVITLSKEDKRELDRFVMSLIAKANE